MPRFDTCNRHPWNPANSFGACMECDPGDYAHARGGELELVRPERSRLASGVTKARVRQRLMRQCVTCDEDIPRSFRSGLCASCKTSYTTRPARECAECGEPTISPWAPRCEPHRIAHRAAVHREVLRAARRREGMVVGKGRHRVPSRIICVQGVCRTPSEWAASMGIKPNTLAQRMRRTSVFEALREAK